MGRFNRLLRKIVVIVLCAAFGVMITEAVGIKAAAKDTVRVSTQKALNAAVKKSNVSKIIFRSDAILDVTIKANEEAKNKELVIDAFYCTVKNKAVFSGITIENVEKYYEMVSGNDITTDNDNNNWIIVSKNKKVNSLTVESESGDFSDNYIIRKGGKIKSISLVYKGSSAPVESSYNTKKRLLTMDFTDIDGHKQSLSCKLDKNGRYTKYEIVSDAEDLNESYVYTYDPNGNYATTVGEDINGSINRTYSYSSDDKILKSETIGYYTDSEAYTYDKNGKCIKYEYTIIETIDGVEYKREYIYDYKFDKNGLRVSRVVEYKGTGNGDGYKCEELVTYNSKRNFTKMTLTYSGEYYGDSSVVYNHYYKYNKAGDCIEYKYETAEGYAVMQYTFNELGETIGKEQTESTGGVSLV